MRNHAGVASSTVSTISPFGRAEEYWMRAGDVPADRDIDQELDLWDAPLPEAAS